MVILCTIDLETREVSLPAGQVIASYDHNVDVIRFQAEAIPGFSLDTSSIKIAAQGPNNVRHDYAVDPSTVAIEEETGYITFDWPIPQGVTEMPIGTFKYGDKGRLIFAVCAEIIDGSTVSKAWHSDDGIITVVAHLEPEAGGGEDPEEEATNAQKIAQLQTDVAVINTQVGALANGSPTPVATVAEMTDESAVYLYTGSETGYTAGNWYYYNGTAWVTGGTYGGAVTDTTLSISGKAADAKAVGDALALKADDTDVTALDTRVSAVEGDILELQDGGYVADQQKISEKINDWLEEHPEATTTVEDNSLTAKKLVVGTLGYVTPEDFGAKGDGVTDDTVAIQSALSSGYNVVFGKDKTYLSSENLTISNSITVEFNNSTIISATRDGSSYVLYVNNCSDVVMQNGSIIGDRTTHTNGTENCHCVRLQSSSNIALRNMKLSDAYADGILISNCQNVYLTDIESFSNGRNNFSVLFGNNLYFNNIYSHDCVGSVAPGHGFTIEPWNDGQNIENVNINNLYSYRNKGNGLEISLYHDFDCRVTVNNAYLVGNLLYGLGVAGCPDVQGFVKINNVFIDGSNITLADICADAFDLYISNVVIQNTVAYAGGVWGSALFLMDNHNTDISFKNIFIDDVLVRNGNHTYLSYCKITNAGNSPCVNVVINNLRCIEGEKQIVSVAGIMYKNVQNNGIIRTSGLILKNNIYTHVYTNSRVTLGDNYNENQDVYIENTGNSDILIETTSNNLGVANINIPPKSSMLCKRTGAGYWELYPKTWWIYAVANSITTISINNIKEVQITRGTASELYYIRYGTALKIIENNSIGVTVSVSDNAITFENTTAGNAKVFIR